MKKQVDSWWDTLCLKYFWPYLEVLLTNACSKPTTKTNRVYSGLTSLTSKVENFAKIVKGF